MQNISISRYLQPMAYAGTIEPNDRSWILFVCNEGPPSLWLHRTIPPEERVTRGLNPTCASEYIPAADFPPGETMTPNTPVSPT